jgi:hypothetical protein
MHECQPNLKVFGCLHFLQASAAPGLSFFLGILEDAPNNGQGDLVTKQTQ